MYNAHRHESGSDDDDSGLTSTQQKFRRSQLLRILKEIFFDEKLIRANGKIIKLKLFEYTHRSKRHRIVKRIITEYFAIHDFDVVGEEIPPCVKDKYWLFFTKPFRNNYYNVDERYIEAIL